MDIDIPTGSAEDNPDYSFSNFYCHPDFFSDKADPAINQVFAGSKTVKEQTDESAKEKEEKKEG
jgi:hypothetical protein